MAHRAPGALDARAAQFFQELQDRITAGIEARRRGRPLPRGLLDAARRAAAGARACSPTGRSFEKAGVAFSDVHGTLRPEMARALPGDGESFRATGISLIFHPTQPAHPDGARQRPPHPARRPRLVRRRHRPDAVLRRPGRRRPLPPHAARPLRRATTTASTRASSAGATTTSSCPIATSRAASAASSSTTWARAPRRRPGSRRPGHRRPWRRIRRRCSRSCATSATPSSRRTCPIVERRRGDAWGERERRWQTAAPRPLRRVQPALRPRHRVRPAHRRARRVDPDVAAARGALGVRLRARAGNARGGVAGGDLSRRRTGPNRRVGVGHRQRTHRAKYGAS